MEFFLPVVLVPGKKPLLGLNDPVLDEIIQVFEGFMDAISHESFDCLNLSLHSINIPVFVLELTLHKIFDFTVGVSVFLHEFLSVLPEFMPSLIKLCIQSR